MKLMVEVNVPLDVEHLARLWLELDDDSQAQFFCIAAKIANNEWAKPRHSIESQAFYIGRHLRECACSTTAGRELVANIYQAMLETRVDNP